MEAEELGAEGDLGVGEEPLFLPTPLRGFCRRRGVGDGHASSRFLFGSDSL